MEQDYLIAKAFGERRHRLREKLRPNEELTNRELNTRMKTKAPVKAVSGAAGFVVPGAGSLAGTWDAERKFRVNRNATKTEARSIQQREQRQRVAAAGTGLGIGVAGMGLGGIKNAVKTRSVKGPAKFGAGVALAGGSALIGRREGKAKGQVEHKIWNRMLDKNPGGRS